MVAIVTRRVCARCRTILAADRPSTDSWCSACERKVLSFEAFLEAFDPTEPVVLAGARMCLNGHDTNKTSVLVNKGGGRMVRQCGECRRTQQAAAQLALRDRNRAAS